jgi:hypothetical protein
MPVAETNHHNGTRPDTNSVEIEQEAIPGGSATTGQPKQFFVSKKTIDFREQNGKTMMIGGACAIIAVVVILFAFSSKHKPGDSKHVQTRSVQTQGVKPKPQASMLTPGDKAADQKTIDPTQDELSATDIENTKNHTSNATAAGDQNQRLAPGSYTASGPSSHSGLSQTTQGTGGGQHFGPSPAQFAKIQPFQPAPYSGQQYDSGVAKSVSTQQAREAKEEVTTPSLVFTAQNTAQPSQSGVSGPEPVTNFGLEPGFHVAAHLESSASTVGESPAVAIIEYDYSRGGQVLIPAGSRAVGKLQAASSTGLVSLTLTDLYMPDGTRVPINAVGLDDKLHLIKGKVTGKNTGKQVVLAALSGVGQLGAGFAMPNSTSTITQQQLAVEQLANNSGRGLDQVVQQMDVSQHIVVTVPAGIQIFVTFVAPQRSLATQPSSLQPRVSR